MRTIKADVCRAIDAHKGEILRIGQEILHTPELGYREQRTSALVKEQFLQWGLSDLAFPAVTGVKGWLRGKSHRASVAVMGELDAVLSPEHPFADPHTGAAHACGHNAQIAGMLGCLFGLSAVIDRLHGDAGGRVCGTGISGQAPVLRENCLFRRQAADDRGRRV